MTSVPSRRLRLSGNSNRFIWLILIALIFAACGGSKRSTRPAYKDPGVKVTPERNPPSRDKDVITVPKVDTIQWTDRTNSGAGPITTPEIHVLREKSILKPHYNIALLAPFRADNMVNGEDIKGNYKRFIDFYTGAKLAARQLEKEGVQLNVKVFDTEYSDATTDRILGDPYLKNTDVIIGPYKRSILTKVINYGKQNKVTVVSPWLSSNSMAEDDPYYLQAKPSLRRHFEAIRDHLIKSGLNEQLVFVVKEGDVARLHELKSIFHFPEDEFGVMPFFSDTLIIHADSLLPEATIFCSYLKKHDDAVFFLPYASASDESLVYNTLRKMNIDRKEKSVMVYGPGTWLEYRDEVKDLLTPLQVRLSVSNLFDMEKSKDSGLMRSYYDAFGTLMSPDAAEGFDLFYFIGKALKNNGTYFQAFGEQESWILNQTGYDIRPVVFAPGTRQARIEFYENFYIQFVEYKDFHFINVP